MRIFYSYVVATLTVTGYEKKGVEICYLAIYSLNVAEDVYTPLMCSVVLNAHVVSLHLFFCNTLQHCPLSFLAVCFPGCSQSVRLNVRLICCGRRFTTSAVCSVSPPAAWRIEQATGDKMFVPCFYFQKLNWVNFGTFVTSHK